MAGYLRQWDMQVIFLGMSYYDYFAEIMEGNWRPDRWEEIEGDLKEAMEASKRAYDKLMKGRDLDQREKLKRAWKSNTLQIIPRADPRAKRAYGIVPWEDFETIVYAAQKEICTMCTADKKQMKDCVLRSALLHTGASDPEKGFAFGACEFSKG